jgi:hypothetical protein
MNKFAILLLAIGLLSMPAFALESAEADGNGTAAVEAGGNASAASLDDSTDGTDVAVNESEVGALPGDWNYGFKRFFENMDKFFTFDKSESAKKHAKYGLMRAMEAHVLSGKAQRLAAEGDEAGANSTLTEVEKLADEQTDELEDAQTDLESAVADGSANETEVEQVQNDTRNSIIVLQRVYEKAPEAAKDGLLRALNNSISNYERHVEKIETKQQEKEQKGNQTMAGNETENETDDGDGSETDNETATGHGQGQVNKTKETGKPEDAGTNVTGKGNGKGGQGQDEEENDGENETEENETED